MLWTLFFLTALQLSAVLVLTGAMLKLKCPAKLKIKRAPRGLWLLLKLLIVLCAIPKIQTRTNTAYMPSGGYTYFTMTITCTEGVTCSGRISHRWYTLYRTYNVYVCIDPCFCFTRNIYIHFQHY